MKKQKDFKGETVKRIFSYLKTEQARGELKTPSQLYSELGIEYTSVKNCLDFLQQLGQIKIVTNGKVSIIQVIEDKPK
jgi:hypothetical protein